MHSISPSIAKNFPLTTALPLADRICDPTYCKVKKLAILLFAILTLIPLAIATITLVLDGCRAIYKFCSDNPPEQPSSQANPINNPSNPIPRLLSPSAIAPVEPLGRIRAIADQRLALNLEQPQFNPLVDLLRRDPYSNRQWNFHGLRITTLLEQLQGYAPTIALLPPEERETTQIALEVDGEERLFDFREIAIFLKRFQADSQPLISGAQRQRLRAPELDPADYVHQLADLGQAYLPQEEQQVVIFDRPNRSSYPPAPASAAPPLAAASSSSSSIPHDHFSHISLAEIEEISTFEKTYIGSMMDSLQGWFLDPGNMDKGKKYAYSLHATKQALTKKFPNWRKLLDRLAKQAPKSKLATGAYCILNALKNCSPSDLPIRLQYAYIVKNLREALLFNEPLSTPELREAHQILQFLCHFKYTSVGMYPFFEDFISKTLRAGGNYELPTFTLETLAQSISDANRRLANASSDYKQRGIAREYKKLQGTLGFGFDPTADSNTPWVHSIQTIQTPRGRKVRTILRHGTPTRDPNLFGFLIREGQNLLRSWVGSLVPEAEQATIIPEYEAHLLADQTKISLYVNHQTHDESGDSSVHGERDRSKVIQSLEKHPNFHFLALPMDGPIWRKSSLTTETLSELKFKLINALLDQTHGFALPKNLNLDSTIITELLKKVHRFYFGGVDLTTLADKKTFLMLFYSELKDYVSEMLDVDFLVSACKDNKDRGNASTTVDMMKNLVKLGKENDPEALQEVFFSVLGPYVIKNEAIIEERLDLALLVIEHFAHLSEAQKREIQNNSNVVDQVVPKESSSWAQMMGKTPFLKTIDGMKHRKEKRIRRESKFNKLLSVDFKQGQVWDLPKLKAQVERDLVRIHIKINGERITLFETLCDRLKIPSELFNQAPPTGEHSRAHLKKMVRLMTMLQQGAAAEATRDASIYLNGNFAGLTVAEPRVKSESSSAHPTTIEVTFDENNQFEYTLRQKMELRDPDGQGNTFPILAKIYVNNQFDALLSWNFTRDRAH